MRDAVVTIDLGPVRFGLLFGLLAVLYGWSLGLVFGVGEDAIRERFMADAEASRAIYLQKAGSEEAATAAIKRMDETAWRYFLRAHLHAGAIGSIAVGYPLSWMLAGMRAPGMGSTAAAKESLLWLAVPSSGGLFVGGLITFGLVAADLFFRRGAGRGRDRASV